MSKSIFAVVLAGLFVLAGSAFAEKSMWDKFKDFFNPGESIECEGPTCDELHKLEPQISKMEGKYSRERRPVNKERYKKELDSLNAIRDSLVFVIKGRPFNDNQRFISSSAVAKSSAALASSASIPASSASGSAEPKVLSASEVAALVCKPDTIYVRDTVKVHDTVYVIVTNKPADVPGSSAGDSAGSSSISETLK